MDVLVQYIRYGRLVSEHLTAITSAAVSGPPRSHGVGIGWVPEVLFLVADRPRGARLFIRFDHSERLDQQLLCLDVNLIPL